MGAISAIAAGATWVLLSRLTHPFTLVLYGTSYGYFLLRIVGQVGAFSWGRFGGGGTVCIS